MTRIRRILAAMSAIAVAGVPPAAAFADTSTRIVGKEFEFEPSKVTVDAGETVTIKFKNKGVMSHNITFKNIDAKTKTIQSGNTTTIEVTIDEPGTYDFVCSVPGHSQAGMRGQLVVK